MTNVIEVPLLGTPVKATVPKLIVLPVASKPVPKTVICVPTLPVFCEAR